MPEHQLSSAYEKMLDLFQNQDNAVLKPLHDAVQTVEKTISALHQRDKYGKLPLLNSDQKDLLMTQHLAVGQAADKLISSELPEEQKNAIRELSGMAAENYRQLRNYSPRSPHSLPDILAWARTFVVDARQGKLNTTVNANQNVRQPLTFLTDKGAEVTGVFTPLKRTTVWQDWNMRFEAAAMQFIGPRSDIKKNLMGNFMRRMDTPEAAKLLDLPEDADHSARLGAFYRKTYLDYGISKQKTMNKLVAEISRIDLEGVPSLKDALKDPKDVENILSGKPISIIENAINHDGTSIINNSIFAKVHDGARLDNRNAAMSAVASLLGVNSLIARSFPMKIIDQNGKNVDGTFMMEAEGVDPCNIRSEDSMLGGESSVKDTDGKGLRSLVDLQVLDYICGNTDRHSKNVCYQFDNNGKFIGVQGFDNDCAFGSYVPKPGDTQTAHLTTIENMGVISASMYQQISRTTPDMLKFSLRGFGLSEKELDAACTRMEQVRKAAAKDLEYFKPKEVSVKKDKRPQPPVEWGRLRVVENSEFRNLDADKLSREYDMSWYRYGKPSKEKSGNFISKALRTIKTIYYAYNRQTEQYRSLRSNFALGSENRGNPGSPRVEAAKGKILGDRMRQCTSFGRTSSEYQAIQTAVAKYTDFQEKLSQRIYSAHQSLNPKDLNQLDSQQDRDMLFDCVVTFADLQEMQELTQAMRTAAQTYLNKKGPEKSNYSTYTKNRIEVAEEVLKFCRNISSNELDTATRNEQRMLENARQSFGMTLEAADKKNAVGKSPESEQKQDDVIKPQEHVKKKKKKKENPNQGNPKL